MPAIQGQRLARVKASKQFIEGAFRNTSRVGTRLKQSPLPLLGELFFGGAARTPPAPLPVSSPLANWASPAGKRGLRVTWLGHSTVLLEVDGLRVLTDPVFGERVSPVSFAGPRRFHRTPVRIAELPRLDAVLLSHDHHDHLCRESMAELARLRVPIVTSLGVGAQLEAFGVLPECIVELDWWEQYTLPGGLLSFTATPSQHFSGRSLLNRNATLWSSWVLQTDHHKLFFSGDTGLTEEFKEIGKRFGPFDLVLLEIGAFHPAWGDIHLGPENALTALRWLNGKALLPVHWGTFNLALHAWDEPAETLVRLAAEQQARVLTPGLGEVFEPVRVEGITPWWRLIR